MQQVKHFIEHNFFITLLLAAFLGLFLPGFGDYSDNIVVILIAGLVYFSGPSIKRDDLLKVDIFQVGIFCVLRFGIFPIILFYIAREIVPEYAEGILLLALMPAAMAVASLCSISSGKAALGLGLTIASSVLAPLFVPAIFSFLGQVVEVNTVGLFITLLLVVFLPIIIYFALTAPFNAPRQWVERHDKVMPILIMSLVLFIVVASYKEQFIDNMDMLIEGALIMTATFFIFYLFGIIFGMFVPKEERSTYVLASGAINNGLAIGLAFLYFDATTTFFIVISEIIWCLYVVAAQHYYSKRPQQ